MIIRAGKLVNGHAIRENVDVHIEADKIEKIETSSISHADLIADILIPGFVDIHCHGGNGHHFFDAESNAAEKAAKFHLNHGTTSLVASLIAAKLDKLEVEIENLIDQFPIKNIVGIHLEGPYLSKIYCGAHNPDFLSAPSLKEIQSLLSVGQSWIKMITIAPELPGALESIAYLRSRGVIAAIGHSDADDKITTAAIKAGATLVTHFFSAMRPIHHRIGGMALTTLFDERIYLELILDSVHIAQEAIAIPRHFASERIIAITDALSVAGQPDGDYTLGTTQVEVRNSIAKIKGKDLLAGSTLTMDKSFKSAVTKLGFTPNQAVRAFCSRPAQMLGLKNVGDIAVGMDADLLVLNDEYELRQVVSKGSLV